MKSTKFRLLPAVAAVAATLGAGAVGNAQAGAYAISFNEITNFVILTNPPALPIGASSVNSSATACLPNANCVSTGGAGVVDALPATRNIAIVNNAYAPQGVQPFSYAWADASIDSQQTLGAPFTRARNIAEGFLATTTTAHATAGNSSGTVITVPVNLAAPAQIAFSFDLDPFMQVALTPDLVNPSQANAILAATISISQQATGQRVFNWVPDGEVGAGGVITGGTEIRDPFSSNISLLALPGAIGPFTFDPNTCPVGSVAPTATDPGGCFLAITNVLPAGNYVIDLAMRETINLQSTIPIPQPATLGLLGLGLGMLGFLGRGRKLQ